MARRKRTFLVLAVLVATLILVGYLAAVGGESAVDQLVALFQKTLEVYNHAW